MLKTKRSDALGDVAKRRRELLGSTTATASTSKSLKALDDDDIFSIEADSRTPGPAPAPSSSPLKTGEKSRSDAVSEKLKAILEDNDNGQYTHSKSSRSKPAIISHGMLLAQQKLSMLKALEESSLQASILPSIPPAIVDCDNDDDEPPLALQPSASAAQSGSLELMRLKFMAKSKQQVIVDVQPKKPLVSYYPAIASKFGATAVKVFCEGKEIGSVDSAESLDLEEDFGLDVVLM